MSNPSRSGVPDEQATARRVPLVSRSSLLLARLQLAVTIVVVTLGTVVTSTGPHGGDPHARRFGFSLHAVAQLHGTSVEILLIVTLVAMGNLARTGAPLLIAMGQFLGADRVSDLDRSALPDLRHIVRVPIEGLVILAAGPSSRLTNLQAGANNLRMTFLLLEADQQTYLRNRFAAA